MQIVMIAMKNGSNRMRHKHAQDELLQEDAIIREEESTRFAEEQFIALAKYLAGSPSIEPFLIIDKRSDLLHKLSALPSLQLASGPLDFFRLWRWQRGKKDLQIIALGESSLPAAWHLAKMRSASCCQIFALFYQPVKLCGKFLQKVSHFICDSNILMQNIQELFNSNSDAKAPEASFLLAGLNAAKWQNALPWQHEAATGHFVFGMAESLFADSGAIDVVRAMAALWQRKELPKWEVRMFGDGSQFDVILEEAEKLGVASRLSLLSSQPLEDIAKYCHAWLAPGYSPLELPTALWAGIAAELPLICTNTQLHMDWLPANKKAALLVQPKSPQEMASAMIEIMKNDNLRNDLIRNSRQWQSAISLTAMSARVKDFLLKKHISEAEKE